MTHRQVERNAREISELVATFNTHVAQQHEMIDTIHKNTAEAKRDVDKVVFRIGCDCRAMRSCRRRSRTRRDPR